MDSTIIAAIVLAVIFAAYLIVSLVKNSNESNNDLYEAIRTMKANDTNV